MAVIELQQRLAMGPGKTDLPVTQIYGPYESFDEATETVEDPYAPSAYYGLTVGVYVYDDINLPVGERTLIGLDEYWWQPNCVWDESLNNGEGGWKDGFVLKFPANTPASFTQKELDKETAALGIADNENDYNAEWREGVGGQQWNNLSDSGDSSEVIDELYPTE